MNLPIGLLVYWTQVVDDELAGMYGMWYYKELYVPQSVEEKKHSIVDLNEKRCIVLGISGTYDQIMDLIIQGDKFYNGGSVNTEEFEKFKSALENGSPVKTCGFSNSLNPTVGFMHRFLSSFVSKAYCYESLHCLS